MINKQGTDAKQELALAMVERFRIVSDESGHDYVIPVWKTNNFYKWVRDGDDMNEDRKYDLPYEGEDFDEFRIDGGVLTFTDPKVG